MLTRRPVKIKFQNGMNLKGALKEILNVVADVFEFTESQEPDYILFGPYGNDVPPAGPYKRIGYFCENIMPDLSICDWAFGIPLETEINNAKYRRIQWHNLNPEELLKKDWDVDKILASKTGFCNFLYTHAVPYREEFFKQLSRYKKIDAPGKRMNNMPSIDRTTTGGWWAAKHQFLSAYKFTISFENYSYPGYQTEKLYDPMLAQSIPIYCGDPDVGKIFNTDSFVNVPEFSRRKESDLVQLIGIKSQSNFIDIRPQYYHSPKDRVQRKLKKIGKEIKMKLKFGAMDFSNAIDEVIALDKDPEKYLACLQEPWFPNNIVPTNTLLRERWIEIFTS